MKDTFNATQLKALRTIATFRLRRVQGGWQAPGSAKVTLGMVSELSRKGAVIIRNYPGGKRPEATRAGNDAIEADNGKKRA